MASCQTCNIQLPVDANCCYRCGTFVNTPFSPVEPIPQHEAEQITIVQTPIQLPEPIRNDRSFSKFIGLFTIAFVIVLAFIGVGSLISRSREENRYIAPPVSANSPSSVMSTNIPSVKPSNQISPASKNIVSPTPVPDSESQVTVNSAQGVGNYAFPERSAANSSYNSNANRTPANQNSYAINLKKREHWPRYISFPRGGTISGSYEARGGFGNDIEVYIFNENEYQKFRNGQQAQPIQNFGRRTSNSFNVHLDQGSYVFVVSNQYATYFSKTVSLFLNISQ
jgi:hypothetical protein